MRKQLVLLALGWVICGTVAAQKGVEDGSRYGHGEDSVRCIQNLSLYQPYAKQGDFASALEFWEVVYKECPAANVNLYIDGIKIRKWQLQKETDPAKKMDYFNLLMEVYDQRITYFGNHAKNPRPNILGQKAVDYLAFHPDGLESDKNQPYAWLKTCIEESTIANFVAPCALAYVQTSCVLANQNPELREQFIADYLKALDVLDAKIAMTPVDLQKAKIRGYMQDIDEVLSASGIANCDNLESIFSTQVESHKTDLAYLKRVVAMFKRVRCTETPTYFAASEYIHNIEPTAESAEGCAYQCVKKEEYLKAAEYMKEAIALATDDATKAEYEYFTASVLFAAKKYSDARAHALQVLQYRSNDGTPYVLIAKMYANSVDMFDDPILKRAVYWAATDKLVKAKSIDPNVAEEANDLIAKYKLQFPGPEDIFMHPDIDLGKSYKVGGWIQENTIVRDNK